VVSVRQSAPGEFAYRDVSQDAAESLPTLRPKEQVAFLHQEIDPLIGVELATECQRGLHGLSPRLRATLDRLLAGDTEKLIAAGLGLRAATVSKYAGKIYRHFGVNSPAELVAYFIASACGCAAGQSAPSRNKRSERRHTP
jgi:DNA-binding CsgD family transcriptional regulator